MDTSVNDEASAETARRRRRKADILASVPRDLFGCCMDYVASASAPDATGDEPTEDARRRLRKAEILDGLDFGSHMSRSGCVAPAADKSPSPPSPSVVSQLSETCERLAASSPPRCTDTPCVSACAVSAPDPTDDEASATSDDARRRRRKAEILAAVPSDLLLAQAQARLSRKRAEETRKRAEEMHAMEMTSAREVLRQCRKADAEREARSKELLTLARVEREARVTRRVEAADTAERAVRSEAESRAAAMAEEARRRYRLSMQSCHGKARPQHRCPKCAEPFAYQLSRSWSMDAHAPVLIECECANWKCQHRWSVVDGGTISLE